MGSVLKEEVWCERHCENYLFWEPPQSAVLNLLTFSFIWSNFPPEAFTNFYPRTTLESFLNTSQFKDSNIANIFIFISIQFSLIARGFEIFHLFIDRSWVQSILSFSIINIREPEEQVEPTGQLLGKYWWAEIKKIKT